MESIKEKNKDVFLNLGLIAYGTLRDIEKLQTMIHDSADSLKIVYMTVSGERLRLVKRGEKIGKRKEPERDRSGT